MILKSETLNASPPETPEALSLKPTRHTPGAALRHFGTVFEPRPCAIASWQCRDQAGLGGYEFKVCRCVEIRAVMCEIIEDALSLLLRLFMTSDPSKQRHFETDSRTATAQKSRGYRDAQSAQHSR